LRNFAVNSCLKTLLVENASERRTVANTSSFANETTFYGLCLMNPLPVLSVLAKEKLKNVSLNQIY